MIDTRARVLLTITKRMLGRTAERNETVEKGLLAAIDSFLARPDEQLPPVVPLLEEYFAAELDVNLALAQQQKAKELLDAATVRERAAQAAIERATAVAGKRKAQDGADVRKGGGA